jgi:hypothetical protein
VDQQALLKDINTKSFHAVSRNLHDLHLAYIDPKTRDVATAVVVRIGARLLLATAGHTVRDRFKSGLAVVTPQLTQIEHSRVPVLRVAAREWPDVGLIELESSSLEHLGKRAIGIDRIWDYGCASPDRLAFVYGYPAEKIRQLPPSQGRIDLDFKPMSYANAPLSIDKWPAMRSKHDPTPDAEKDIFLRYDPEEPMVRFAENNGDDDLVCPHGMSGGGWWQGPSKSEQRWSPEDIKLIGLQTSWNARAKYIRGCQIHHWLKLVLDSYPNLRDEVEGACLRVRNAGNNA